MSNVFIASLNKNIVSKSRRFHHDMNVLNRLHCKTSVDDANTLRKKDKLRESPTYVPRSVHAN